MENPIFPFNLTKPAKSRSVLRIYCDMRSSGASTKIRRAENTAVRGPSGDVGLPLRADMATGSNQPWALSSTGLKFISYWDVSYMAEEACSWSLRFSAGLALQVAVKCVGVGYARVGAVVSWPQGPEPSRPKGAEPKWASARLSWWGMDIRNSLFLLFLGWSWCESQGARVLNHPMGTSSFSRPWTACFWIWINLVLVIRAADPLTNSNHRFIPPVNHYLISSQIIW